MRTKQCGHNLIGANVYVHDWGCLGNEKGLFVVAGWTRSSITLLRIKRNDLNWMTVFMDAAHLNCLMSYRST